MRFIIAAAFLVLSPNIASAAEKPLTVVELFTSQGCSSCPPADKYLAYLAERGDTDRVLALSFHVDYWDYLGWKDPYSSPVNTSRQRSYGRNMDLRYVYTPQMVIQGADQTTGSNRGGVSALIRKARALPRVPVTIKRGESGFIINLGKAATPVDADLLLVIYDDRHSTAVKRGENRGETIINRNVVRSIRRIGGWQGDKTSFTLSQADIGSGDKCAVIVQTKGSGPILGAAMMALN